MVTSGRLTAWHPLPRGAVPHPLSNLTSDEVDDHMDESPHARSLTDARRPARGWGRLLVAVFAVFGVVVLAPAVGALARAEDGAGPASLDVLSALGYLVLAACVAHNGRRVRMVGWVALATEAVGLVTVSLLGPETATAWSGWGSAWGYLPVVLPLVGAAQMWLNDPRRIVVNAERITDLSETISGTVRRER